jgi:hypothetical protein
MPVNFKKYIFKKFKINYKILIFNKIRLISKTKMLIK